MQLATQWRVGFNGKTGLDYQPLFHLLDRLQLSAAEWEETFSDIRHMERAVLEDQSKQT